MTDRRMTTDPDAEHDPALSAAYRELAAERAPEHLDRSVLADAERAVRPAYSRLRIWTRPAAWAAVVMLSVALLLETTNVPPPEAPVPAAGEPANQTGGLAPGDTAAGIDERKAEAPARKSQISSQAEQLIVIDDDVAKRAAEEARIRQSPSVQSEAATVRGPEETPPACDADARAEPDSWLECIARLDDNGDLEAARAERELFAETFPDFYAR